jgi:hypothetical protein
MNCQLTTIPGETKDDDPMEEDGDEVNARFYCIFKKIVVDLSKPPKVHIRQPSQEG